LAEIGSPYINIENMFQYCVNTHIIVRENKNTNLT